MSGRAVVVICAALAVAAAFFWFRQKEPLTVSVAPVETGNVRASVVNTRAGTVEACRRASLAPAMGGNIASLPVTEGDRVEAGQVLLELWNEDHRAEVERARRDAVANRGRAKEACVIANTARREARRLTSLRERGLASEEETERAEGDADAREAACAASRDAARVAEARILVSEANLERTILRAPFDGVIAEINGELGEFVTPSPVGVATLPTVDLIDSSCLYISAPIDEVDAPRVRSGMDAVVTMDAFKQRSFPGFVRRVAPYVLDLEKQARTVEVEAEIREPDSDLLPGYSADVEVILDTRENVIRVPTQAIMDGTRVYVLDESAGVIVEREIQTGISNWEHTEVVSGLATEELVVLSIDREGVEDGAEAVAE